VSLYYPANARSAAQRAEMARLEAAGVCLFCPGTADGQDIGVHFTDHWQVRPNVYPYDGARLHLLLVPDVHVTSLLDLPVQVQDDLWAALAWVESRYMLTSWTVAARNGACCDTGGTIEHLHLHVIVADPEGPPVRLSIGSGNGVARGTG